MSILEYDCVDSTNSTLAQLASHYDEGVWVLAHRQTAARGRQGRAWDSGVGNLHASTLVKLSPSDPPPSSLALAAAVALHRALTDATPISSAALRIKWPNDLLAQRGGGWGKISGILLERSGDAVVIGFGVNLAHAPMLARPTAKVADFGSAPKPVDFCLALERCFAKELERWRTRGAADTKHRWLDRAHPVGTPLQAHAGADELLSGTFDGLDDSGGLRLRLADGSVRVMHAGDVWQG